MRKMVTRIAPWQSAKILALTYFALGLLLAVPIGLLSSFVPAEPGQAKPGPFFFLILPFVYGIAGLIFVPIGCWIYSGVEFNVETKSDA